MRSLKSVISLAVPAVAATGLLGILYWLFQRRKPPRQRNPTDPPDKITNTCQTEVSVSCDKNEQVEIPNHGCSPQDIVSINHDENTYKEEKVEILAHNFNAHGIVSDNGDERTCKPGKEEMVEDGSGDSVNIAGYKTVDKQEASTDTDDQVISVETHSNMNKTAENNLEEIDPVISKVGEQLVEQTIKEAIAICVGTQCEGSNAKVVNVPAEDIVDVDKTTDTEIRPASTAASSDSIKQTENASVAPSHVEEPIVMSSTETHLHSEPAYSSLNTSDLNENTGEMDNSEDPGMVNNLESQIILENAFLSENVSPILKSDLSRQDNGTSDCVSTSQSDSELLVQDKQTVSKPWHSDVAETDFCSETNLESSDNHLLTNSIEHDDCDGKSSQCPEQTKCDTGLNMSKDAELAERRSAKVLRHSGDRYRTDEPSRHGGERLSNGDVSSNCDNTSEASNDSGKGSSLAGSTNSPPILDEERVFEFNIPSEMCGLFIGTRGKTIKTLRDQSGARLRLRNNPYTPDFQICVVEGPQSAIDLALNTIRRKFPSIKYPGMDMAPLEQGQGQGRVGNGTGSNPVLNPEIMQLSLPEGVSVDVVVSSIVDAGRLFVQQPTHPTFPSLDRLNTCMSSCYIQEGGVPDIPRPIEMGVICAAPMLNGWYRAQIMVNYDANAECDIKYVDYGGYSRISDQCLKQIRSDFMTLPFQAVECYLANITLLQNETYFSAEAAAVLEELTQGKLLQAQVVGRADDGIPYVHIYQITGNTPALMVNRELVNRGVCRWIEVLS